MNMEEHMSKQVRNGCSFTNDNICLNRFHLERSRTAWVCANDIKNLKPIENHSFSRFIPQERGF